MLTQEQQQTIQEIHLPMDDTYMNVIRFGNGPRAFVMIAGVSLCGLEGQGAGVAAAYEAFLTNYTVYLFDRKKVLPEGYTVQDMAEDVARALDALGVTEADVYGVSQGGMIAQCLAIAHPALVRRLALCSTQARVGKTMKEVAARWIELAKQADVVGLNRYFFERVYSAAFLDTVRELLPTLEKIGTPEDCARFAVLAHVCSAFDVYDQLPAITCPTLVIGDKGDRVIDIASSMEIINALHCQHHIYEGYSHAVFDEAPDVKDRLLAFFRA